MIHWRTMLLGLALTCGLATGCKQQVFLAERDLQNVAHLPPTLERDPSESIVPILNVAAPTPPDVNQPDRNPRYMSLDEALAIGLENGTTNSRQPGSGAVDDTLASFQGGQITGQGETVRIISLLPAIAQTAIENQLARFDAQWITSMNWTTTDNLQQGLQSFQNGQSASFATSFIKALPTGGTANVSFLTDYRLLSSPPTGQFGVLNPSYTTRLVFGIDHPLWRDYGVEINNLLTRHPQGTPFSPVPNTHAGSFAGHLNALSPFAAAPEGILIARIRMDQAKAEFERQVNALVLNIEVAYWKLYQAYGRLYSFEEVMRIAHKSLMINEAKYKVGTKGPADYFPILGQYQDFRGQRLAALADVLEKERSLRGLLGMPIEDGTRLVPITPPNLANYQPSYEAAVKDALVYRPELVLARENLRVAHFQLLREKNNIKPDLRAAAQYAPVGFGNRLDGRGTFVDGTGADRPQNALQSLASDHFNDWNIGLILTVPLGFRAEMANIRAARLSLAQGYYFLKDQEERSLRIVAQQYQELSKWYNLIEMRRAARKAYAESVIARFEQFKAGKETADFLLEAQRRLADAQTSEYEAIAEYNNSLARFEWSKGTILHHNNVFISDGPLPACAQVRAVEHERERSKARVLCERPRPLEHPGQFVQACGEVTGDPTLVNLDSSEEQNSVKASPAAVQASQAPAKATPAPAQAPTVPSKASPAPAKATPVPLPPPRKAPTPVAPSQEKPATPVTTAPAPAAPAKTASPVAATPEKTVVPAGYNAKAPRATVVDTDKAPAKAPVALPNNKLWSRWPEKSAATVIKPNSSSGTATVTPGTAKSEPPPKAKTRSAAVAAQKPVATAQKKAPPTQKTPKAAGARVTSGLVLVESTDRDMPAEKAAVPTPNFVPATARPPVFTPARQTPSSDLPVIPSLPSEIVLPPVR
jgi:outer membrane protein TolC